jgi:photosystem II stability/assembly factor-like uncharacterized protein
VNWVQGPKLDEYGKGTVTSSDGYKMAVMTTKTLRLSVDGGASWETILAKQNFQSLTASADMSKIAATMSKDYTAVLFTTQDGGKSWSEQSFPDAWSMKLSSSSSGSLLVAGIHGGPLYTSDDWGESWVLRTSAGNHAWTKIAVSPDGRRLVAPVWGGYIQVSQDGGATWAELAIAGSKYWRAAACSNDGRKVAACATHSYGEYMYLSSDFGQTWWRQDSAGKHQWSDVALSEDGAHIVASTYKDDERTLGFIYTYTYASSLSLGPSAQTTLSQVASSDLVQESEVSVYIQVVRGQQVSPFVS